MFFNSMRNEKERKTRPEFLFANLSALKFIFICHRNNCIQYGYILAQMIFIRFE